ncbi:MAG: hypothetical protein QXP97_07970 [Desulfurococcus sp.]|uniref:hypothetical protein n=1 Tax=Desulfurococcus sp. TaxID=51678 RepID=UPI003160DE68
MSSIGYFKIENSRSRSGKHAASSTLLIYRRGIGVVKPGRENIIEETEARPTYVKGSAKSIKITLAHGDFAIYGWFVKNYMGRVKGYISVYNHRGELVYRAKYLNGVARLGVGSPVYAWLARIFIEALNIPVSKTHLGDEK